MEPNNSIKIFENKNIRSVWDSTQGKWYFSVMDVIAALSDSNRPRKYWDDLKHRLQDEGSELSEKIGQLKLPAADGKKYLTDVVDIEQLFRLVQSISSPKAEAFKQWFAQIARERWEEIANPEQEQSLEQLMGYPTK